MSKSLYEQQGDCNLILDFKNAFPFWFRSPSFSVEFKHDSMLFLLSVSIVTETVKKKKKISVAKHLLSSHIVACRQVFFLEQLAESTHFHSWVKFQVRVPMNGCVCVLERLPFMSAACYAICQHPLAVELVAAVSQHQQSLVIIKKKEKKEPDVKQCSLYKWNETPKTESSRTILTSSSVFAV